MTTLLGLLPCALILASASQGATALASQEASNEGHFELIRSQEQALTADRAKVREARRALLLAEGRPGRLPGGLPGARDGFTADGALHTTGIHPSDMAQPAPATGPLLGTGSGPPMTTETPDLSIDRSRVHLGWSGQDAWLRGETYKAKVGPGGFSYIPFLGSRAPRSYPVSFRLSGARLGGEALPLRKGGTLLLPDACQSEPGELAATGQLPGEVTRFTIDRGPLRVQYDFSARAVEQSFAFDPTGQTGDLELEIDVDSELQCTPNTDGSLQFGCRESQPFGGVHYGAVTVLDSAGMRLEIPTEWTEGGLKLRVPGSFIEEATGTIVVDPLIWTFTVDGGAGFQRDVAVGRSGLSYNGAIDTRAFTYEDQFSGTDVDIYFKAYTAQGLVESTYIEVGDESWEDPTISGWGRIEFAGAYFLVAATRANPALGQSGVTGKIIRLGQTPSLTAPLVLGGTGANYVDHSPDAAVRTNSAAVSVTDYFVVLYSRDFSSDGDLRYRSVSLSGALGSTFSLESSPSIDTVLFSAGQDAYSELGDGATNVAMVQQDLSGGLFSLVLAKLDGTPGSGGILMGPQTAETYAPGHYPGELCTSSTQAFNIGRAWGVVYDPYDGTNSDVVLLMVEGVDVTRRTDLTVAAHRNVALDQAEPRVETAFRNFVVSYLEADPVNGGYLAFVSSWTPSANSPDVVIAEDRERLGRVSDDSNYHRGSGAEMTRDTMLGNASDDVLLGWDRQGNGQQDVRGGYYDAFNNGQYAGESYCFGNPNSTGERGYMLIGSPLFSDPSRRILLAQRLPQNSPGIFLVGTEAASLPGAGGSLGVLCVGGTIGRYGTVSDSGTNGSALLVVDVDMVPQGLGLTTIQPGDTWHWTYWHRDTGPAGASSNFTNAVLQRY